MGLLGAGIMMSDHCGTSNVVALVSVALVPKCTVGVQAGQKARNWLIFYQDLESTTVCNIQSYVHAALLQTPTLCATTAHPPTMPCWHCVHSAGNRGNTCTHLPMVSVCKVRA
jgi:hypothetical protein